MKPSWKPLRYFTAAVAASVPATTECMVSTPLLTYSSSVRPSVTSKSGERDGGLRWYAGRHYRLSRR